MSKQGTYSVRISGLGEGDHDFSFELDKKFFDSFEQTELTDGEVRADIVLVKKHGVMELHFMVTGKVEVVCDRCLEPFWTAITSSHIIYVKIGNQPEEVNEDVVVIGKDDHEIEVSQFLYEFIVLALPVKRIHSKDQDGKSMCDPGMLEKLEAHRIKKADQEANTDPRWDALKGIIEKNN